MGNQTVPDARSPCIVWNPDRCRLGDRVRGAQFRSSVARVLGGAGFRVTGEHRQFVLPIALHIQLVGSLRNAARFRRSHRDGSIRLPGLPA